MRSWGITLWSFFQDAAQLQVYGPHANTLIDNAGIIQIFGVKNYRMAQDLANVIGGISADELLHMPRNEQVLLIDSQLLRCKQVRHYEDQMFRKAG
jgi:type IV secretion system protein VirD4